MCKNSIPNEILKNNDFFSPSRIASLGNTRKSCNALKYKLEKQRKRYRLQVIARKVLNTKQLNACCRSIIPKQGILSGYEQVQIYHHIPSDSFKFGGLMTCGSVWTCPICASVITEHRRNELRTGLDNWLSVSSNNSALLLTLTIPHYFDSDIDFITTQLNDSHRKFTNSRKWKEMCEQYQIVGRIRTLEVTYGNNGWHPHFHVLLFTEQKVDNIEEMEAEMLKQWQLACELGNLPRPNKHGCKLQDGSKASSYVSKWGIEHEMTKGHLKNVNCNDSLSPFAILARCDTEENDTVTVVKYSKLFKDYAECFKGRRQLVWSKGLRELLGLKREKSDTEVASHSNHSSSVLFAEIPIKYWTLVIRQNKQGELLEICYNGFDALQIWLQALLL